MNIYLDKSLETHLRSIPPDWQCNFKSQDKSH